MPAVHAARADVRATPTQVMWGHCVDLLQRGFSSGSILTVDPDDARKLGKPWTRR
jgi:hypothetical protein